MRKVRSRPLTEKDKQEMDRFAIYLRQLEQAKRAGVDRKEAVKVIHDVVYGPPSTRVTS